MSLPVAPPKCKRDYNTRGGERKTLDHAPSVSYTSRFVETLENGVKHTILNVLKSEERKSHAETYLATENSSPRPRAWLSSAHGDQKWTESLEGSSGTWPSPIGGKGQPCEESELERRQRLRQRSGSIIRKVRIGKAVAAARSGRFCTIACGRPYAPTPLADA